MERHTDPEMDRDLDERTDSTAGDGESHATTGGAAAAGAVTGGAIGMVGGPVGAAIGAVGGAIVGAAAERIMHSDDDAERSRQGFDNDHDGNKFIEDRAKEPMAGAGEMHGTAETGATTGRTTAPSVGRADERMQLREEELRATKTPVQAGEVRLGKQVVEEQQTLDVPVTREEVVVERNPVDRRPADRPIAESGQQTIDVPVREERVDVTKTPVVYEEVGVGKRQVTETQQVSDTVRREEARVEHEGNVDTRGTGLTGTTGTTGTTRDIETRDLESRDR